MASRSSGGSGLVVTIAILGVASLALFILTIVFLSKYQAASRNLAQTMADNEEIIRAGERQSDALNRFKAAANQERKSVFGYLSESMRATMQRAAGAPNQTVDGLAAEMDKEGITGTSLLAALRDRKAEIDALNAKVRQADDARTTALADLQNEVDRTKRLTDSHNATVQAMNNEINKYKGEVETYRQSVDSTKAFMDNQIEKMRDDMSTLQSTLNEQIRTLQNDNLRLKDQIAKLNVAQAGNLLRPRSEESLVDGEIIALNQAANTITINRGKADKVILGMSFSVYADATAIRPDAAGNYPRPKATIEVISVGDGTSTCRITGEVKGNPVVRGDVIANPVYDPEKVYTFLVYGNFDTNGDGLATPREADDIKAMVTSWNAKSVDDLTGNVDYLVLGDRPLLPAPPGVNDPIEIVQQYMRLNEIAQRYDRLLEQAISTSVPVLNQNRFYTLIGRRPGVR